MTNPTTKTSQKHPSPSVFIRGHSRRAFVSENQSRDRQGATRFSGALPRGRSLTVAAQIVKRTSVAVCVCLCLSVAHFLKAEPIPPNVQSAVDRGLNWLAKNQDPSGGWNTSNLPNQSAPAATTSLAVMAFMARGHVPGQGPYGDNLNRAVDYVLALQQPTGLLASSDKRYAMYEHGISTVMLCEAYGMLDDPRQKQAHIAIAKATRLILNAQQIRKSPTDQGGWRYTPTSNDSDVSVTGWQLMALRGAANIDAAVPKKAIDDGLAYILAHTAPSGAFTYGGGTNEHTDAALTGTGILALELLGQHNSKQAIAAGEYLKDPRNLNLADTYYFYTVYYCSQAAWQLGDRYWSAINPIIRDSLIKRQSPTGEWLISNSNPEQIAGPALATSMAILALTVPYRYLPIYQR
ncbi:MAG: terpene cyclase/mutase family protein [Phycisphaerales bacterium]|nr:terpene cyclase/mutase family protein [Phycisphaerales bacterium]